jgi:hypothetical protein
MTSRFTVLNLKVYFAMTNNKFCSFLLFKHKEQIKIKLLLHLIIQFNSIYLCAKLNSPEANYKVSTGKKMGRVRSKKVILLLSLLIHLIIIIIIIIPWR